MLPLQQVGFANFSHLKTQPANPGDNTANNFGQRKAARLHELEAQLDENWDSMWGAVAKIRRFEAELAALEAKRSSPKSNDPPPASTSQHPNGMTSAAAASSERRAATLRRRIDGLITFRDARATQRNRLLEQRDKAEATTHARRRRQKERREKKRLWRDLGVSIGKISLSNEERAKEKEEEGEDTTRKTTRSKKRKTGKEMKEVDDGDDSESEEDDVEIIV